MEQYNVNNEDNNSLTAPIKTSDEFKKIRSVESQIKTLEDTISIQHQEISKLRRDISRLKGEISDIITVLKERG